MAGAADPTTVADLVSARAADDRRALVFEGRTWSWADVVDEARTRAAMLADARRDGPFHVGVLLDNVPEHLFLLLGAGLGGATIVGLNPTRRGEHLARDIRHTDCQLVITDAEHRALLEGLDLGLVADRIHTIDDPAYLASMPPGAGWRPANPPGPDDLYLLLFTSGSSGAPKAVRMTQGRAARASASPVCAPDAVPYCAMPLHHGNALNAIVLPALRVGATIVLKRRFSASEWIDDVRAHGCTYASVIGRVLTYILATPERSDDADNGLAFVLAPESSAADMATFEQRFGCPVFAGYGSSENAIVLLPAPRSVPGALGVAPDGEDIAVIDPDRVEECPVARFDRDGRLLNAAEAIGELVGRSALGRFEGYYRNDEAEGRRRRNGWYWSGDLAYRDADGVFWFAGRTDDWIRVDGENFATAPIERILARLPGARAVAVYGVPDERNAEDQVMVTIELAAGADFDPATFADFLDAQRDLGTKWAPRYVRVTERLPVTGNDKVAKAPLRSERWHTADPMWWRPDRRRRDYEELTAGDRNLLDAELARNRPGLATR